MSSKKKHISPFNDSLLQALSSLDKQIARDVNSRTPQEKETHGTQKWSAYADRVESTTALLLDGIGDKVIQLDSLLILAQSFSKALSIITADLGADGLGTVRTEYCREAFRVISRDCMEGESSLNGGQVTLN